MLTFISYVAFLGWSKMCNHPLWRLHMLGCLFSVAVIVVAMMYLIRERKRRAALRAERAGGETKIYGGMWTTGCASFVEAAYPRKMSSVMPNIWFLSGCLDLGTAFYQIGELAFPASSFRRCRPR